MVNPPSSNQLDIQVEQEANALEHNTALHNLLHRLSGEPNELPPFAWVEKLRPKGEHHLGVQTIDVGQIVGSVDRYSDFDHRFLPKEPHILQHWAELRRKQLKGVEFPPIEVYKVGEVFFVKDGNHRTALAKARGQEFIEADVTEIEVVVPPDCCDHGKELLLKAEYAAFLETTQLDTLRPDHVEFGFTVLGRYEKLLEHIRGHQYFMQLDHKREIPWDEAVGHWYDTLYLPTVQTIREHDMLAEFPGRTEADLYLWVMEYRLVQYMRGTTLSVPEATVGLEQRYGKGLLGKLRQFWHRVSRW
jgi:hypothetical protein